MSDMTGGLSGGFEFFGVSPQLSERHDLAPARPLNVEELRQVVFGAWYNRQVNSPSVLALLAELKEDIEGDIFSHGLAELVKADIFRLNGNPDKAIVLSSAAEGLFEKYGSFIGVGDAKFVKADAYLSCGAVNEARSLLSEAAGLYRDAGDFVRASMADCWLAHQIQYGGQEATTYIDAALISAQNIPDNPISRCFFLIYSGGVSFVRGRFTESITLWQQSHDIAIAIKATWLAIQLSMQIGSAYANLYDLPTAIEWKEKAFEIARKTGWPEAMGNSLSSMAETTTSIGDFTRALALFNEAKVYLDSIPKTRRHVINLNAHANLLIILGNYESALILLESGLEIAKAIGNPDLELPNRIGASIAFSNLRFFEKSRSTAIEARSRARLLGNPYYEVEALRALAKSYRSVENPEYNKAIDTLKSALDVAESLDGLVIRPEIYTELARDYEAIGNYERALHYERRARDSWQRNFDQQNGARILAMQVRFDTARAKADAEHHRQLAAAEAARAAALDQANKVLERLSDIGQEVTARLDSEGVFAILSRHIHELMVADCLYIGLLDEAGQAIDIRFRIEDGQRLPPRQVALASENLSARCVRDNEEILVEVPDPPPSRAVPGTRPMRTVLLRPLTLGARVLGVVSVQCDRMGAYGPRELLIFRTLCAYGAIALANADAYGQLDRAVTDLRAALNRLVQQEKMAALGQLVAGVAHEVNTPLGVTLSAISQLHDNILELKGTLERNALTRTSLADHLRLSTDLADLAQRNTVRAAEMIRSFKEVAVDRDSDDRRRFELGDYLREVAALMRSHISGAGNEIAFETGIIHMDTYPGALARAVSHLLANCADHAYPAGQPGSVRVEARLPEPGIAEIRISDMGVGIPPEHLPKLFDPFFTTGRSSGHMGLGLHIAFNQVTQQLRGTIAISSTPGAGTVATIRIPRDLSTSDGLPLA